MEEGNDGSETWLPTAALWQNVRTKKALRPNVVQKNGDEEENVSTSWGNERIGKTHGCKYEDITQNNSTQSDTTH